MAETLARGGDFLFNGALGKRIFSPEDFSAEQRQFADTTEEFVKKEVLPDLDRIEAQDFALVVEKLRQCAKLGLFLVDVPEEYGGLELDKVTSMLLAEKMAPTGSFSITYGGQTGIGLLPLVYYGTAEQKERYLDKLTTGEWVGAYALTEPDCGSDPLSARTTAVLSEDGSHYLLNGVKQFITNAGFADLFTVFAKIDGKQFSAFLMERGTPGLSIGNEEKKMGLKGSSTAQVIMENARVPATNLLGEPGKGHKIAFNALNIGRLKVASTAGGMAKGAFAEAASYATQRKQFGRLIGSFGAIQEKLADMTVAVFASDSVVYRVAGLLDDRIATLDRSGADYYDRYQKAIEEYAIECAVAKVFCTDVLADVVDEVVQVHGGYGYISDYACERYYRDERIQRIFEGTNEINRILIPTLLFRRAESGSFDLRGSVRAVQGALAGGAAGTPPGDGVFALEASAVQNLKRLFLAVLGAAEKTIESQEVLLAIADLAIGVFALESVVLRGEQVYAAASDNKKQLLKAVVKAAAFERTSRFQVAATRCLAYVGGGETLRGAVSTLCACPVEGLLEAKQLLSQAAQAAGKYPF